MPVLADDPSIAHLKVYETIWVGRDKMGPGGEFVKKNARVVVNDQKKNGRLDPNQCNSPVVNMSTCMCVEAVCCLRGQSYKGGDVPGAYLRGEQTESEQMLLRPPPGFREYDERGVEIYWLMQHPLYGQSDAGAIWNRTINKHNTDPPPEGLGYERSTHDPGLYSKEVNKSGDRCTKVLYVDDLKVYYDDGARSEADRDVGSISRKFEVEFSEENPKQDYFLGADRLRHDKHSATVYSETYIMLQVKRFLPEGFEPSERFPAHYSYTPADERLVKAHAAAVANKQPAPDELVKRNSSLIGALQHAVKYRPEIACALGMCAQCLTFPTEELYHCAERILVYLARSPRMGTTFTGKADGANVLRAYADSNWTETRSTTGYCIMLGNATVSSASRRQHCITMSSCEAELVALADCAIELLFIIGVVTFIGISCDSAIQVYTDNKAAHDLCNRFTTAQNSRHVDRKMFKMRELRGAGVVEVNHIPTDKNPADLFTKVLGRQVFERHRATVLNTGAKNRDAIDPSRTCSGQISDHMSHPATGASKV